MSTPCSPSGLNSPYQYPAQHWELDDGRQPTNQVIGQCRPAAYITPIPQPRRQRGQAQQRSLILDEGKINATFLIPDEMLQKRMRESLVVGTARH